MPLLKRCLHENEREIYYLACDTETGRVFIVHDANKEDPNIEPITMDLDWFLLAKGAAQDHLVRLIGTLVADEPHTKAEPTTTSLSAAPSTRRWQIWERR